MHNEKFQNILSPIQIGNRLFRNRIFASPTGTQFTTINNMPTDEAIYYCERKAQGGAASVCVGDVAVDALTSLHGPQASADDHGLGRGHMSKLAQHINRHGAVAACELIHGGNAATMSHTMGNKIYGPTAVTYQGWGGTIVAEEMTEDMIHQTIDKFYNSAKNAKQWGFGMITIHGGHGWLLSQFLSPAINKEPTNGVALLKTICASRLPLLMPSAVP